MSDQAHQPAWPEEPWVVGIGEEAAVVFQDGEVDPILVVDHDRDLPDEDAARTAQRVVDCVNALAGVADPAAFVAAAKHYVLACIASDDGIDLANCQSTDATVLGDAQQGPAWNALVEALGFNSLPSAEALDQYRTLCGGAA